MALLRKINTRAKTENNSGFGANASDYGGRFVNKDGKPNITKSGIAFFERISWFHSMLSMPGWKFLLIILGFYITVNLLFAGVYYINGVEHLHGMATNSELEKFAEAFFFSTQTFTTVGYGRISPTGFSTSAIAAVEAMLGLLSFAIATGLFYGRFSRPRAYIRFSENALIAPYKDTTALMIRLAPFKNATLTDAEVSIFLALVTEEAGKTVNKFFPLELEYKKVNALNLSWTVVHPINEDSPFFRFTASDYAESRGEVMVLFKAFDDLFSNTVVARSSYTFNEIVVGAKFEPMYHRDVKGNRTVLNLDKLNSHLPADINFAVTGNEQAVS